MSADMSLKTTADVHGFLQPVIWNDHLYMGSCRVMLCRWANEPIYNEEAASSTTSINIHRSLSDISFTLDWQTFSSVACSHCILACYLWFVRQVCPEQHCPAHSGLPQEVRHPRLPVLHLPHWWAVWECQRSLWRTGVSLDPWLLFIFLSQYIIFYFAHTDSSSSLGFGQHTIGLLGIN